MSIGELEEGKVCCRCKETKPVNSFYRCGARLRPECRSCTKQSTRPNLATEKRKEFSLDYDLKRNHGISLATYRMLVEQQNGLCCICSRPPTGKVRLVVDHCHTTGDLRGIVCTHCNSVLGHSFDSPEVLRNAALYLEGNRVDINKYREKVWRTINSAVDADQLLNEMLQGE